MKAFARATHTTDPSPESQLEMQTRRRCDLAEKLASQQVDRTRLIAERDERRQEQHAATVSALLSEGEPAAETAATKRLSAVEAELANVNERIGPLTDAIAQLDIRVSETRERLKAESRERCRVATKALTNRQLVLVAELEKLDREVRDLHQQAGLQVPAANLLFAIFISQWRPAAKALGGDA